MFKTKILYLFFITIFGCSPVVQVSDRKIDQVETVKVEKTVIKGDWVKTTPAGCRLWTDEGGVGITAKWSGKCKNDFADGKGDAELYRNGYLLSKYSGEYKQGKRHGKGVLVTPRARYEGMFADDLVSGKGVLIWTVDGTKYQGNFLKGYRTGEGTIEFANKVRYTGGFLDNKKHGKGRVEVQKDSPEIEYWLGRGIWTKSTKGKEVYVVAAQYEQDKLIGTDPDRNSLRTLQGRSVINSKKIPAEFLIKTKQGCHLVNPNPVAGESVSWTGKCTHGLAHGSGVLQWFSNENTPAKTVYMEAGFQMNPYSPGGALVISKRNPRCKFSLPLSGAERIENLLDVDYVGKCPEGGGTLINEIRENGEADIYLNGEFFAKYKGAFARGAVPVNGELIFHTGTKFIFKDNVSFAGFITPDTLSKWAANTAVVRATNDKVDDSLFDIKVSFAASKLQPIERTSKALLLTIDTITSASELKMNYQALPVNISIMNNKSYVITLNVVIKVAESRKSGIWGVAGDNYKIDKNIDIIVDKTTGFRKSGSLILHELETYLNGLGVTTTVKVSKPLVSLVSVRAND